SIGRLRVNCFSPLQQSLFASISVHFSAPFALSEPCSRLPPSRGSVISPDRLGDLPRDQIQADFLVAYQIHRPFDRMLQFAHVPGPLVPLKTSLDIG
ncbi:hypothetical protein, partial [Escherichia coli]|uniref:hypothetical protein n=1 Tax=Escherichia coli TaxID=562 RepID=UPI001E424955